MISRETAHTIMIVDDDPLMRDIVRKVLERSGYTIVAEAVDGNEAVAKYVELRPKVTLMDVCMPKKSGIDATKDIVTHDKDAKVVMCSAIDHRALAKVAREAGASDVIFKPYTINHLRNVIHRVMQV